MHPFELLETQTLPLGEKVECVLACGLKILEAMFVVNRQRFFGFAAERAVGVVGSGAWCHSYQPLAGTTRRRFSNDSMKAGLLATVSERALIMRAPTFGSSAQNGTRPQRNRSRRGVPTSSQSSTGAGSVGAMLKSGPHSMSATGSARRSFASVENVVLRPKRPHMLQVSHGLRSTPTAGARGQGRSGALIQS